jgi:hypothetical protein
MAGKNYFSPTTQERSRTAVESSNGTNFIIIFLIALRIAFSSDR